LFTVLQIYYFLPGFTNIGTSIMADKESLNAFIKTLVEFLEAISESYSDCKATKTAYLQLKTYLKVPGSKEVVIRAFHEALTPYFGAVNKGDLGSLKPGTIEILDKVHFVDKWTAADAETREIITEYVQSLCKLCQTWSLMKKMPKAFSKKIKGIAEKVAHGLQTGKGLDLSGIDLKALGAEAQKNVDPAEIMALAQSLSSDGTLGAVMSQLQSGKK